MVNKKQKGHTEAFKRNLAQKKRNFLEAFRKCGQVGKAAESIGVLRGVIWTWRQEDQKFATAFDDADSHIGIIAQDEAVRRAIQGVEEPVFFEGRQVATKRVYSDYLMEKVLKAHNRRYKHNSDLGVESDQPFNIIIKQAPPSTNGNGPTGK